MNAAHEGIADAGKDNSTVVGATLLLAFVAFTVCLTIYAMREMEASYDGFDSLLDRSARLALRGAEGSARLAGMKADILAFVDRLDRVDAKADMSGARDEIESAWPAGPWTAAQATAGRDRLVGAIERLEARLSLQRLSIRRSFNALFGAVSLALTASLIWSAALWHRYRVDGIEASWTQKSMKQALYAEEEARKRIARDLHDDSIQDIAAARMLCDRAAEAADRSIGRGLASEAAAILAEAGRKLRGLAYDLRPPALERSGLVPALEALCARNQSLFGRDILFLAAEKLPRLGDDAALQAYRIVQEAVTNSMRHAPGNRIEIGVEPSFRAGKQGMLIKVEDMPASAVREQGAPRIASERGGLGMAIMRERASYIGGRIELEWTEGGLVVRIFVPETET